MEGQTRLRCRDCGRTDSVRGELPAEYHACFVQVVQRGGWAVAPGSKVEFICGACLESYEGSESRDDAEKIR